MAFYRQFYPNAWINEFSSLTQKDSRYLAAYLKTSRHSNLTGVYFVTFSAISEETLMDQESIAKAMSDLEKHRIAFYDSASQQVYVPSFARENLNLRKTPKLSDHRMAALQAHYDDLKSSWLCDMFWADYGAACGLEMRSDAGTIPPPQTIIMASAPFLASSQPAKEEIAELLRRYTAEQQEAIMLAWEMIALNRNRGKVSDNILLTELRRWSKIDIRRVIYAINVYVDREHSYEDGRDERYLYGIMRKATQVEIDQHEGVETTSGSTPKVRRVSSLTEHNVAVLKQLREEEGYGMPVDPH